MIYDCLSIYLCITIYLQFTIRYIYWSVRRCKGGRRRRRRVLHCIMVFILLLCREHYIPIVYHWLV